MSYEQINKLHRISIIQDKNINELKKKLQIMYEEYVSKNNQLMDNNNKIKRYKNIAKKSKAELEQNNKTYLCNICYKNKKNIILNPCFHFNLCDVCLKKVKNCPICREEIECYHYIYD